VTIEQSRYIVCYKQLTGWRGERYCEARREERSTVTIEQSR